MSKVSRHLSVRIAEVCCLALLMSIVAASPARAATKFQPRPLRQTPSVPVHAVMAKEPGQDIAAAKARRGAPHAVTLPRPGSVIIDLPTAHTPSAQARAGDLPVSGSTPDSSSPVGGAATAAAFAAKPTAFWTAVRDKVMAGDPQKGVQKRSG